MPVRTTNRVMANTVFFNLQNIQRRVNRAQSQVSSGRVVNVASDDPTAAARGLLFRTQLSVNGQFQKNNDSAQAWVNTSDKALDVATQILHRTRELIIQGSTDTYTQGQRNAIATELRQLFGQLGQVANSTYGDQYVFSGTRTTTQAFTVDSQATTPTFTYNGNTGIIQRVVDSGAVITVNLIGTNVFKPVFSVLRDAIVALESGDVATLSSTVLGQAESALDNLLINRASLGALVNRVDFTVERLTDLNVRLNEFKSKAEDLDYTRGITDLVTQENVYRASLATGARIVQPSLLDFLR